MGRQTLAVPSDVTDRASLEALLAAVLAKFDKVDILVNCAGCTERGAILDLAHDLGLEADLVLSPLVLRAGMTLRPEILRDAVPL